MRSTHRLPTSIACADVLWAFSRASSSSSGLMLDSWISRVTSRPALTRFSVGIVSPEKLNGQPRQSRPPIREALSLVAALRVFRGQRRGRKNDNGDDEAKRTHAIPQPSLCLITTP